jgi:hypothetical protein
MEPRSFERRVAVLGGVGNLAIAVLIVGCAQIIGIEDLPPLPGDGGPPGPGDAAVDGLDPGLGGHVARGIAAGLLAPVAVELRVGNDVELLTVTEDGVFMFETRLENGTSYTVVLVDPTLPCMLRNQSGVIAGADATIELTCTGASLESVILSGIAPVIALLPGKTDYVVDLPLSQSSATITATVDFDGDTLAIAGTPVASGAPSAPIMLDLGDNPVDIVVENDLGWQRTYHLTLRRAAQLAQYAYGKASNTGAGDGLGISVALSGDTLAVGTPLEDSAATGVGGDEANDSLAQSGAVYVFRRTGAVWQQEAYLKASNTGLGDEFGRSVALSGDILAIGAPLEDSSATGINGNQTSNAAAQSGAIYVFHRTGTSWQQEAYIKASNTGGNDRFGTTVALSGDTLAVGAPFEDSAATGVGGSETDNTASSSGAVYVFRRLDTTWQQEAYVKASNSAADDLFGSSLALSGDTLAVGAYLEDSEATGIDGNQSDNTATDSGAVYVFRRSGMDWQQEAYVKASNTGAADVFGVSVVLSGDTLAVGASLEDSAATGVNGGQSNNSALESGAVYVFRRSGTFWQQEAYVKASNTGPGDRFGAGVALSGDTLAIAAPLEDSAATGAGGNQSDSSATDSGATYVFRRTGTVWQQTAYLKASNTGLGDDFGTSVALSDNALAVGAPLEDSAAIGVGGNQLDGSAMDSGAVYIFH